jgi:hypothetical protein
MGHARCGKVEGQDAMKASVEQMISEMLAAATEDDKTVNLWRRGNHLKLYTNGAAVLNYHDRWVRGDSLEELYENFLAERKAVRLEGLEKVCYEAGKKGYSVEVNPAGLIFIQEGDKCVQVCSNVAEAKDYLVKPTYEDSP